MSEQDNKLIDRYVGERMRSRRKASGLTQQELAEAIGISHQQVQRYESGENPLSLTRALEIAALLNVKPDYFYEGAPLGAAPADKSTDGIIRRNQQRPLKLLLVEDKPNDEMLFRKAVEQSSVACQVSAVQVPENVMPLLREQAAIGPTALPDLILLDINMPRINGLMLLQEIKKERGLRHIPIVMLTNSVRSKDLLDAYAMQANGFLQKSSELHMFYEDVSQLLHYWRHTMVLTNAA